MVLFEAHLLDAMDASCVYLFIFVSFLSILKYLSVRVEQITRFLGVFHGGSGNFWSINLQ